MQPKVIENIWAKDPESLAEELVSDLKDGLAEGEAVTRLKQSGENTFSRGRSRSPVWLFLAQFKSPLIIILLMAVGVTVTFAEYVDAGVIMLAVLVAVGLGFFQEYKAERATAALRSYIEERVRVWRSGKEIVIDARSVVPGDIVLLRAGERVPADGRLFETYELEVDESILTGESLPVAKVIETLEESTALPERDNMVFGGTYVAEGQGRVLITATGSKTEFGRIAEAVLSQNETKTPLQEAVSNMSWFIALITLLLVVGVYFLGLSRGMEHLDIFLVAVAIAVGSIPEALPPGLTAILSVGVERIAKKRGIVRSLLAAETLGSATVVITDKTGTLTTGAMELVDTLTVESLLTDTPSKAKDSLEILRNAAVNVSVVITDSSKKPADWDINGRHLDVGIAKAAASLGVPVVDIIAAARPVKLFSSVRKYSIYEYEDELIVLGAPDILLRHSELSKEEYAQALEAVETKSEEGKRLLGVAIQSKNADNSKDELKLKFLGVLVFNDPLRPKIKESIEEIEQSGVRILMATGDLPGTAAAIAKSLGWENTETHVLTGEGMRSMTDEELLDALARVRVFARMTPEDKYRIVEILQGTGEVVAMLGDGVNDAPSLRRASIGVAVGSGTDVAKGVADLVLLDDDFHVIKAAIDEGKLIVSNIRKTFVYLMSSAFDEIVLLGGALVFGLTLPLTPLQVIWVNFVTGSIPAIAYAFDTQKAPRRPRENVILNGEVITLSFGIGLVSSAALLTLYYWLTQNGFDNALGRTFLFTCFASYILFVAFSFRNLRKPLFSYPLFENKVLNVGVFVGVLALLMTIYTPFFQGIFDTVALPVYWLLWVAVWIIGNVALVEFAKWAIVYGDEKRQSRAKRTDNK